MIRTVRAEEITEAVRALCIEANYILPADVREALTAARAAEDWPAARDILDILLQNADIAAFSHAALCQDTGMACVFIRLGQDVHLDGAPLARAVDEGVRRGYREGYLRASVVSDPLERQNTGDNTPALLHTEIVPGDRVHITVAPKGFGSENMSRLKMLKPAEGADGVRDFVLETVRLAGPNPCPPIVVGVGLGGSFDRAALLAKKALLRPLDRRSDLPHIAALETELLEKINALGIGPQGLGGKTTALAVAVETFPTHIAALPVAVNIGCHVTRHAEIVL